MAQTYQDSKYLDYAVSMIDYMLYQRDDVRAARGELDVLQKPYVKAPPFYLNNRDLAAPCWRHKTDCKTILDGQITSGIMHFVRLVMESGNFGAYEATKRLWKRSWPISSTPKRLSVSLLNCCIKPTAGSIPGV